MSGYAEAKESIRSPGAAVTGIWGTPDLLCACWTLAPRDYSSCPLNQHPISPVTPSILFLSSNLMRGYI